MAIEHPRPNLMRDLWMADRAKNHLAMVGAVPWWKRALYWLVSL
jgi:hypothetical protein